MSALYSYQEEAVDFVCRKKRCALFMGMGLGKTIITLTAIQRLREQGECAKVLIIAPLRVAQSVWLQEASKWEATKMLRFSLIIGTQKQRVKGLESNADIYVINRENVAWLHSYKRDWGFDTFIIDESSSFKSSKSVRFRKLKIHTAKAANVVLLTGTPISNGIIDLWSQMYLVDNGKRLGMYKKQYHQKFFTPVFHTSFPKYTENKGARDKVAALIADVCISLNAEDVQRGGLGKVAITRNIFLSKKEGEGYTALKKEFIAEIGDAEIASKNEVVNAHKLLQLCNGFAYKEDGESEAFHSKKIEALAEIVDDAKENMLVAYNFKQDKKMLLAAFPHARVLNTGQDIADWNAGKISMLLAHPASAGYGLNLQFGGSMIVWYGLNWSMELYEQFNARLDRDGQKQMVRIIHIIAKDCIDEYVLSNLLKKSKNNHSLTEYLKMDSQKKQKVLFCR